MTLHQTPQKPPTKYGGLLSIRMLSALMCAFLIVFATTATLVLTFRFSIAVTNTVANKHVIGITAKAKGEVENFLKRPLSLVIGMQFTFAKGTRRLPNDIEPHNPLWYQNYWDIFIIAMRGSDFEYNYVGIGFEDGNSLCCRNHNTEQFRCDFVTWAKHSLSVKKRSMLVRIFNRSDSSFVNGKTSNTHYDARTRSWYNHLAHTPGNIKWNRINLNVDPIRATVGLNAILFNETGTMLGVVWTNIAVTDLDLFIDDIATTPGSVSVLIDNEDVLLSSSHSTPFLTFRNVSISYNETVPYNCMKNKPRNYQNFVLMCRETTDSYPYLPLRELKAINPKIVKEGTDGNSRLLTLDGTDYFVTVAPIVTPMASDMHWRIILFLPEVDIVGGIIEARNLAIYISIAIIIIAIIVSYLIIRLLLRPLNALAEDMYRVATLQDVVDVSGDPSATTGADDTGPLKKGDTEQSLSSLSEIANLQFAFNAMRTELGKLKSYLPQSVLAQLYGSDDLSDEGDADQEQLCSRQGTSIGSSMMGYSGKDLPLNSDCLNQSVGKGSNRSSQSGGSQTATLKTCTNLTQRRVTMVSLNIAGYHTSLTASDVYKIPSIHSALVSAVSLACAENRGVMDGFQGDRFLASFNAVTNVGNHVVQGALAAHTACMAAETMKTPLTMTAGLASGSAIVGTMGNATIKRFTILGHVVSTAATLERLAKRYRVSGGVLVGGAAVTDVENFFDVLTVDAAVLPISTAGAGWRARIAALMSPKSASSNEWMYELQEGSEKSCYGDANHAFAAFLEGNHAEASRIVETLLDGKHDPGSTSVGDALKRLMSEPAVDGRRYVSPMTDFYLQCVLPKGTTAATYMCHASANPLNSMTNLESCGSSLLISSFDTNPGPQPI